MTLPNHKIEVKDLSKKGIIFREEVLKGGRNKKPFIFKGYKTEEDRINETIKNNRYLFNYPEKEDSKISKTIEEKEDVFNFDIPNPNSKLAPLGLDKEKLNYMMKNDIILQPKMRFKARTDLERVYDALNGRYLKESEKGVLERQLKNIGLYSFEKPKDIIRKQELLKVGNKNINISNINEEEEENGNESKRAYKIKQNPLIEDNKKEEKAKNNIYGSGNVYYVPKHYEYKPWRRNLELNSEAERILSEYHVKTHFKAAEEIAENKMITKKSDMDKIIEKKKKIENQKKRKADPFNFENHHFKENDNNEEYIPYDKNENPFSEKKNVFYDKSTLNALSKIAFKQPVEKPIKDEKNEYSIKKESAFEGDTKINKKQLVDEHNVLIDGELYYKDTQFDIIANKVLNNCHVYKHKSDQNNIHLKRGDGKLMITHGLSVSEFEKKYNFEET